MTFLTPLPGIVLGAIGVPCLIVLYLLKLRRRAVRVTSSMLWTSGDRDLQVNAPLQKLRWSWLLLLQLLALALFAGALARPALDGASGSAARVVILIDHSASMNAVDAAGEKGATDRLSAARAEALATIERLNATARTGTPVEFAVVSFAWRPVVVSPFTASVAQTSAAVRSIGPTDQPGRLDEALALVRSFRRDGAEEEAAPAALAVCLFTDSPAPAIGSGVDLTVSTVRPFVGAAKTDNVGIVGLSARRTYEDPTSVRVFVRLESAKAEPLDVPVTIEVDGRVHETRSAHLPGKAPDSADPSETSLTFTLESPGSAVIAVSIGRPDALACDNGAALVLSAAREPSILLVGKAGPNGLPDVEPALHDALDSTCPGAVRDVTLEAYDAASAQSPPSEDLIVFDRVTPAALPAGRATLSVGAPPAATVAVERSAGSTTFVSWRRTHPVLRYVDLDGVRMPRAVLRASESAPLTPLAESSEGVILGLIEEKSGVKRLVLASELGPSTWTSDYSFALFIANAVDYLTSRADASVGRMVRTTEGVRVTPAPGARTITAAGPVTRTVDVGSVPGPLTLGVLERAGVYVLTGTVDREPAIAANLLDAAETLTFPLAKVTAGDAGPVAGTKNVVAREIWEWFVLGAVLLSGIEWILFARRIRT